MSVRARSTSHLRLANASDAARSSPETLEESLAFEQLIAELSTRFVHLPPEAVDGAIVEALRRVCVPLDIDFSVLWQWSAETPGLIEPTHVYRAVEGLEAAEPFRQEHFPWVEGEMRAGRAVVLPSMDDFPPEAGLDRENALRIGLRSSLTLPLATGGEPLVGALAFNALRAPRSWPEPLVRRLRLIGQLFTHALARARRDLELQENRERLALAADSAEAGLWTLEFPTGAIWATERTRAIFGFSPEEPLSMSRVEASIEPEDRERVLAAIEHARIGGDLVGLEYRIRRAGESQVRWIAARGRVRLDSAGEAKRLTGFVIDVSERKQAEEALRASEARLEAGAELAGFGYYEVDYRAGIAFFDARLRALLGVPPDCQQGIEPMEFFLARVHAEDRGRLLEMRERLHDGRLKDAAVEYRYLHPSQGERWMRHVARVSERDSEGRVQLACGAISDTTERRRREEALRQSLAEIERLKDRLQAETDYLKAEIQATPAQSEITGKGPAIRNVLRLVEQVAPTDSSVLVQGETGTGKELVARAIHRLSRRNRHLMVKVNCAALPAGLVESELFGRERGAYTGALTRQIGRFEIADGSTLFLDEIGELPLDVQAKLLRVLETGEFERLGAPKTLKVNVRVIAATNRDLGEEVRQGRFRGDLFYRLNVFPIRVPPLRERPEDIPLLVWAFLAELSSRMGKEITQVPRKTMEALQRRAWPGNVRELRNLIEHGAILTTGSTLTMPVLDEVATGAQIPQTLAEAERDLIMRALERAGGHVKGVHGAAAALGINPATLYSRMKKLGIPLPQHRDNGSA